MKTYFQTPLLILLMLFSAFKTSSTQVITGKVTSAKDGSALQGVSVQFKNTSSGVVTSIHGHYAIPAPESAILIFSFIGYITKEVTVGKDRVINVELIPNKNLLEEMIIKESNQAKLQKHYPSQQLMGSVAGIMIRGNGIVAQQYDVQDYNTDDYSAINENRFLTAKQNPVSTFGIDVDAASYSNVRRYINNGNLPPVDAVRIEELINYFDYNYPQPKGNNPVSITTEVSTAPWNTHHQLVKIGLQGKTIPTANLPASNLVFLIDVSGSMRSQNKLPLVQASMRLLTDQLREKDKVSIVVYAGAAGIVLPSTSGNRKQTIKDAINNLQAGGSTAGGEGIKLAYKTAVNHFIKGGNNRVILATDGDFNVGSSSDAEMQRLIETEREKGVFLTVLGYGMGNYKDNKMEILADKGNGNYAYIDDIGEAKKVLINEFGGTLFTIAKDVKLQVEFNPAKVQAYRLMGYENRLLAKEDFNNDKKDAGDLGSGHTVTALYEIIPVGVKSSFIDKVDDLKYQTPEKANSLAASSELLTIKLRYKNSNEDTSKLITKAVQNEQISWNQTSTNFRLAAGVAAYGMLLRNSEFKQNTSYENVINWLANAKGEDKEGYRAELLKMVKLSALLDKDLVSSADKRINE